MSIARDIRSLSSGTVSTVIRDQWFADMASNAWQRVRTRMLGINPIQSRDGYIVDRVQFAFSVFAECYEADRNWGGWGDAWRDWVKELDTVWFKVSYMGGTDYEMRGCNGRIETKSRASEYEASIYNGSRDEFERCVVPKIGCVWNWDLGGSRGWDRPLGNRILCLFPLHTALWFVDERGSGGTFHHVISEDWPAPKIGESPSGDRCMWDCDKQFDPPVELWQEWRDEAAKRAGRRLSCVAG